MKNSFTEYLIKNGWIEVSFLTYQFQENKSVELFFDTSNQVELYIRVCLNFLFKPQKSQ